MEIKTNRPEDSVSNLLTDLHSYSGMTHSTSGVPQGPRIPSAFFQYRASIAMVNESQVPAVCTQCIPFVFPHPASVALTTHG